VLEVEYGLVNAGTNGVVAGNQREGTGTVFVEAGGTQGNRICRWPFGRLGARSRADRAAYVRNAAK
jgi:hypothetical protein